MDINVHSQIKKHFIFIDLDDLEKKSQRSQQLTTFTG
jgi:hypothetical protein